MCFPLHYPSHVNLSLGFESSFEMFLWIVISISYEGPFLDYAVFLLVPFLQVSFLFSFLMNLPGWSFSYPRISTIYYLDSKSLCLFFKVFYNLSFVRRPMEPGEWDLLYACGWGRGYKEMATYLLEFRIPRCVPSLFLIYLHVLHQWLADFSCKGKIINTLGFVGLGLHYNYSTLSLCKSSHDYL